MPFSGAVPDLRLLAVPFKSYVQPMIVMCAIPFGIIGAFAGHMVMGKTLTVPDLRLL
ncbi:MAG: efflux RND transporter permease subunit [bacterium]|nr:efflux RND transporter permease subunit [bacterium]